MKTHIHHGIEGGKIRGRGCNRGILRGSFLRKLSLGLIVAFAGFLAIPGAQAKMSLFQQVSIELFGKGARINLKNTNAAELQASLQKYFARHGVPSCQLMTTDLQILFGGGINKNFNAMSSASVIESAAAVTNGAIVAPISYSLVASGTVSATYVAQISTAVSTPSSLQNNALAIASAAPSEALSVASTIIAAANLTGSQANMVTLAAQYGAANPGTGASVFSGPLSSVIVSPTS